MQRFDGRTALVTGGGSGIGAATCRRLAAEGAAVVVTDRDEDSAAKVAADVGGLGLRLDVTDRQSIGAAVHDAEAAFGAIDVLVNAAGGGSFAFFLDTDETVWARDIAVNLFGVVACTHAVLGGMHHRRRGSIVSVASEAGHVGTIAGATYAAAKGGVIAFTKSIARESAIHHVRSNVVVPGPIETPLLNDSVDAFGRGGPALKQGMIDATVLARAGTPEEVAASIAFLASDDASFITGHTLAVSGGLSMA